jgi:hypothetical protein
MKENQGSDYVTPIAADRWSALFLGPAKSDAYTEAALYGGGDWFKGLDSVVKDVLVWAGGGELLYDSIMKTVEILKEKHGRVEVVVQKGASHEDFIVERLIGYKLPQKGEGTVVLEEWVKARL